jgi:hypothetical protein
MIHPGIYYFLTLTRLKRQETSMTDGVFEKSVSGFYVIGNQIYNLRYKFRILRIDVTFEFIIASTSPTEFYMWITRKDRNGRYPTYREIINIVPDKYEESMFTDYKHSSTLSMLDYYERVIYINIIRMIKSDIKDGIYEGKAYENNRKPGGAD